MKNLISLETRKVLLKPHMFGLAVANIIIFLLSVFTSSLLTQNGNMPSFNGLPPAQLDTVSLALMLVRATLIVWEAIFLSVFVIEEYRNKTISLLYTYPVNRTKLLLAKLLLVCGIMLLFHTASCIFQYACIFLASRYFVFVTFSLGDIWVQAVTAVSAIMLGLFPLYVGMIKKSTIATVVSSIVNTPRMDFDMRRGIAHCKSWNTVDILGGQRMIKEVNQVCGKLNEALGFSVKLPNPGKKAVKSAALCNLIAGAGLIAAGAAFSSKWCAALGGLGIVSSIILRKEGSHKSNDK